MHICPICSKETSEKSWCVECRRENAKVYRAENKENARAASARWREKNRKRKETPDTDSIFPPIPTENKKETAEIEFPLVYNRPEPVDTTYVSDPNTQWKTLPDGSRVLHRKHPLDGTAEEMEGWRKEIKEWWETLPEEMKFKP